jgi:hypothetical protein
LGITVAYPRLSPATKPTPLHAAALAPGLLPSTLLSTLRRAALSSLTLLTRLSTLPRLLAALTLLRSLSLSLTSLSAPRRQALYLATQPLHVIECSRLRALSRLTLSITLRTHALLRLPNLIVQLPKSGSNLSLGPIRIRIDPPP